MSQDKLCSTQAPPHWKMMQAEQDAARRIKNATDGLILYLAEITAAAIANENDRLEPNGNDYSEPSRQIRRPAAR